MDFDKIKKIHFIGLGGIGTSAVAKFFKLRGAEVSGSDLEKTEITDDCEALGIKFFLGHQEDNVPADANLIVYSDAVPQNNPEREQAAKLGITQMSYAEVLGEISKTKRTIAVSGTNGKSTTTAMLGLILEAAGFDPTVIVGSKVKTFAYGNLRIGKSDWLVVEGDEYRAHMLYLRPEIIVLTNLEEDHLDFYKDLDDIIEKFRQYVQLLPDKGCFLLNNDDLGCQKLLMTLDESISKKAYYYGLDGNYEVSDISFDDEVTKFKVNYSLDTSLHLPGIFNVYNALAAGACALRLDIPAKIICKTLADFSGIWRRFEKVGQYNGALIVSDYGHHPSAIKQTIRGARDFYPGQRIVLVYQPHQHNRTKVLFNDFVEALKLPDVLILSEIYNVAGRVAEEDKDVSSKKLIDTIKKENAFYGGDLEKTEQLTRETIKPNDVVIIMGAGSIDQVARKLVG
ncbi:MAG: UDP-N-acetylmuramate--L-alanine ligase [bacterium]|nr:UDP-N-acetylmuramate--L-alanine ligase [bacterium]